MTLLWVPIAGLVLGAVAWVGLRGLGAMSLGTEPPHRRSRRDWRAGRDQRAEPHGLWERLDAVPSGWILAVIVAAGAWILAWLIVLVIGLNFLS